MAVSVKYPTIYKIVKYQHVTKHSAAKVDCDLTRMLIDCREH